MPKQHDQPPPLVVALQWTSRITTIALEMAVPGVIGYWLDRRLGSGLVLLVLGVVTGFVTGIISLVRLAQQPPPDGQRDK